MVIHQMNLKEKTVYVIGSIVVIYGAFAGRDLTNLSELIEGSAMVALIVSIFIVFVYINRRGIGDWHPKYND
jgi:Na+/proline symporter